MVINNEPDKMLTVRDVAEILHVHPNTLRRWHEQGRIAAYRISTRGDLRFRQSDIARFITEFNPYKQNERKDLTDKSDAESPLKGEHRAYPGLGAPDIHTIPGR